MQVSIEAGEGTERTLKVQVPAEKIKQEVDNRMQSMKGSVKIDGFRPGKVPLSVIEKHYGAQILQEVAGEIVQNTFRDALAQESLNLVGNPVFTAQPAILGEPLDYSATFDVAEEITLAPVSEITLERLEAEVQDTNVDNMIETLRKQRATWSEVDRATVDGDKVSISFTGTVDGKSFDGGAAENVPVVIGSGSMIPGFEEQLIGLSKSDATTITVPFPEDYNAKELAGKEAKFDIEVKTIEVSALPEINEEFAKAFGIEDGNIDQLKVAMKTNMERELTNRIRFDLKAKVMDQLIENNQFNVPGSVVTAEAELLQKQSPEITTGEKAPVEAFLNEATRRVKLGAIFGEILKQTQMTASPELVKERLEVMAKDYSDPDEFVKHYYGNPDLLASVENVVIEELIIDWVVDGAKVTDVKTTFDELMK